MVRPKVSEYQHAYRGVDPTLTADFLGKCDYVAKRRLLESLHIDSPFEWDTPEPSDNEDDVGKITSRFKHQTQLVPDKYSPTSEQPVIRKCVKVGHKNRNSKAVQVDSSPPPGRSPSSSCNVARSKSASPYGSTATSYFRSYRPFVNDLPFVRRADQGVGKCYHVHNTAPSEEEEFDGCLHPSEFSSYASGNKTRTVSGKRTFNVRADQGVYSTALRASAGRVAVSPPPVRRGGRYSGMCAYSDCRCSKNY